MDNLHNNSVSDGVTRDELDGLTKEELIERVVSMQSHIRQLKNILMKKTVQTNGVSKKCPKNERPFDFSRYKTRHIAMKILYLGWDYLGFTAQEWTQETIEEPLFDALLKTRLIQSRQTSNYHRCGRTDKGVSAFSQIISLDIRTNLKTGRGVITPENYIEREDQRNSGDNETIQEINYSLILNSVLPENIRVICWSPVESDFSARFSCKSRTYKYLFPKSNLDIDRMRIASNYLLGDHDFRNLCKMDINNGVINYKRKIFTVDLKQFSDDNNINSNSSMYTLTITGRAFLWHQIRCIVALLFLIGQHKEEPNIIEELLDIDKHPNKPQYCMSADFPLILFDCSFSDNDINDWIYDKKALTQLVTDLQKLWTRHAIKADIIKLMLNSLTEDLKTRFSCDNDFSTFSAHIEALSMGVRNKLYKPLLDRPVCESLEGRLSKSNKRTKLSNQVNESLK
ncbi:tRNA pseudouridine(38/39) synthase-like [Oppia nitens]|uniref:tRNA pseudouridine(38/39) synthase-like n=1 Tax=Oppia nitens TaxID=1686743 RepID=UPI0023DBC1C3|nr:tRNA pseudouridine(38/39) synthase-like [Oppia nitens]